MIEPAAHGPESCDSCKFTFVVEVGEAGADGTYYECRCHAPQLTNTQAGWPKVKLTDWCGEYSAITGAE